MCLLNDRLNGISHMKNEKSLRMRDRAKSIPRQKILFLSIYIIYLILFAAWSISIWNRPAGTYQELIFPWMISSLVINTIGLIIVDKRKYYDVCVWFLVLSYAFMFGHVFTYVSEMQTTLLWDPTAVYSRQAKFHAAIYAVAALCSFTVGCMVAGTAKPIDYKTKVGANDRLFYIGVGCLLAGLICNVYSSWSVVSVTQAAGSYASYTDASTNGVVTSIGFLFVPGVIYLLFSQKLTSSGQLLLFGGSVVYFLSVMTLSGSRKTAIFAIVALALAYIVSRTPKLSILKLTGICVLGLLFLNLVYVIRETRFDLLEVIPTFLESVKSLDFLESILGESLTEMGLSFYSVVGIVQTVPAVFPYELGMTIVRSVCSILPIGWAVGDFFDAGSSTYVVNQYLGAPVGASIFGDLYWNWGFIGGCIASLAFGAILALMFNRLAFSIELLPQYLSIGYVLLIGVRSGFFELARPLFLVVVVPLLIDFMYLHYRSRKQNG